MTPDTVVCDGNWIAHRAYAVGGRDGAVAAVLQTVIALQRDWQPTELIIVWDRYHVASIRRALLSDYKTGREPPPHEFLDILDELRETQALLGLGVEHVMPGAEPDGTYGEADDCAATLAWHATAPVLLVSRDKDWLQLLTPDNEVGILRETHRDAVLHEPHNVQELTGLSAAGWHSYLCLRGDTTDRIPGLPRVGDQRARSIIEATSQDVVQRILDGDGDAVTRELDAAAPGLARYLIGCEDRLVLAHELVRLRDVPLERWGAAFDLPSALAAIEALAGEHLARQAADAWDLEL